MLGSLRLTGEAIRTRSRSAIAALGVAVLCNAQPLCAQEEKLDLRVEASIAADDNVTRSTGAGNKLSDTIYGATATKSHFISLAERTRLSLAATFAVEAFHRYSGLSHASIGLQGELQYRPARAFDSPTFGVFGRLTGDLYNSGLRDGYRTSVGARVLQPLTDRIELFAALAYNTRNADSTVFDNEDYSARLNLDYLVSRQGTLYASFEFRRGQTVSTALSDPAAPNVVEAEVPDDAFPGRTAYRLKARTDIATLGYSHGFGEDQSVDLSLRSVRSTLVHAPSIRYYDNQATLAWLIRF